MKRKVLNTDENDTLNAMANVRNYGAGTENGQYAVSKQTEPGEEEDEEDDEEEYYTEDEPLPDEIANPQEQDNGDEMA